MRAASFNIMGDDFIARMDVTIRNNRIGGNNGNGVSGYTTQAPGAPDGILCVNIQGNTGSGDYLLNQNGGLTVGPFTAPGGGVFLLDPASGGNSGTINTIGTIGSASCNTP